MVNAVLVIDMLKGGISAILRPKRCRYHPFCQTVAGKRAGERQ